MARNGSGVYSLPAGYAATSGNSATAAQHNTPLEDLESDANAARPIVAGGTGAASASSARTNLGLEIGADVQAWSDNLDVVNQAVYATRAAFVTDAGAGVFDNVADGFIVHVGVIAEAQLLSFMRSDGATAISDLSNWLPAGPLYVDHFAENTTPGTTDMASGFSAAMSYAADNPQTIYLRGTDYRTTETVTYPAAQVGVALEGAAPAAYLNDSPTRIIADHTSGPGVRLRFERQTLRNVLVAASSSRQSTGGNSDHGILVEPEDDATSAVNSGLVEDVGVREHPGSGVVQSGNANHTIYNRVKVRDVGVHGFWLSDGDATSRTNEGRPGQNRIIDCRVFTQGGHHLLAGDTAGSGTYRLIVDNFELGSMPASNTHLETDDGVRVHGEGAVFMSCAFAGRTGGSPTYGGICLSGPGHRLIACRYIGVTHPVRLVGNASEPTEDIVLDGMTASSDTTLDPIVLVPTPADVDGVTVRAPISGVTSYVSSDVEGVQAVEQNAVSDLDRTYSVRDIEAYPTGEDALYATREDGVVQVRIERTGTGAAEGALRASGGNIELGSISDDDTVLIRNGSKGVTIASDSVDFTKPVVLERGADLTISGGEITVTHSYHRINTEADAASDDLETINGTGKDGQVLKIRAATGTRNVVIKHNVGNIKTGSGADITLDESAQIAEFIYDEPFSAWMLVSST